MDVFKDIVGDEKTVELFRSTFQAPLPMSGSASSSLGDLPAGLDYVSAQGSKRELAITSWNTQSHHYQTSAGYTINATVNAVETRSPPRVTILFDGALNQVVARMTSLNMTTRRQFLKGQGRFISTMGELFYELPPNHSSRSSPYAEATALAIAKAYDEGRLINEPPPDMPGDSDVGESSRPTTTFARANQPAVTNSDQSTYTAATPPSKHNTSLVVPVRSVRTVSMAFKGFKKSEPPKSPAMIAIEAYATGSDRAATQPYISTTRGVLSRDVSSIQELVAFAAPYNVSHVDTAPALRGLLFAYPLSEDVWKYDSHDGRFIRRQQRSTRKKVKLSIRQTPDAERIRVRVLAVTLPAFASHLKNLDPEMAAQGADGVAVSGMDTDWVAIPISSDMVNCPWLLEYILIHTTTEIWSGKLSILSASVHTGNPRDANIYATSMPAAHQVHIPGPKKVLLVMLDENTYAQASTLALPGIGSIPVYRGARIVQEVEAFSTFWKDIHPHLYGLITEEAYPLSCRNMVRCLQFVEDNLCVSMAFQLAVTLAAELASIVPESPALHAADDGLYSDELSGGWTIGAHDMNSRRPRHTCTNVDEGTEDNIRTRLRRMLHGYSFASTSPMQQHALSYTTLAESTIVADGNYIGTSTYWQSQTPEHVHPQYQCNVANSIYRVLAGLGMIIKDDYKYQFCTTGGLSNVITMQGVALTLSLGLALTKSDVSRRAWSGIGVNEAPVSQTPIRTWIFNLTQGMVLPTNTDAHMTSKINANFSISSEIEAYYGIPTTSQLWGQAICMPYPAFLQWGATFSIDMVGSYTITEGVITANLESPHLLVDNENNSAISWLATTLDTHAYLPALYMDHARTVPYMLHMSAEDWQIHTAGDAHTYAVPSGLMSNLICTSLKHHYRHVASPGVALIINKNAMRSKVAAWSVASLQYPDPPNLDFLQKLGSTASQVQKDQEGGDKILTPTSIKETETKGEPSQPKEPTH